MLSTFRRGSVPSLLLPQLLVALPLVLTAQSAHAHISVDDGGTHMARTTEQKTSPCGANGAARGTNVFKYKPGATINISVAEIIPHPGYFRIAFDSDGDDDFVVPAGTDGKDGDCAGDPKCGAGMADFCNSDAVLLDNLDQHASGAPKTYTWSVKLPDIECDNCTLQIIQMMNDLDVHRRPYPADDIYYQCIDIVLSKDAPDVTDMPVKNNGMECRSATSTGAAGAPSSAGAGGSSGAAGAPASAAGAGGSAAGAGGSGSAKPDDAKAPAAAGAGAAGTKATATATAGAAAPSTTTPSTSGNAPASGAKGTAGAAASGTAGAAATSGTATSGTATSGTATSGVTSESAPASSESGGCQAIDGSTGWFGPAALGLLTLSLRSYRRRRNRAA